MIILSILFHLQSLGLDLGTTTSAVAVLNTTASPPSPTILSNCLSSVNLHDDGFSVGDPSATYSSVKRLIGKGFGWFHQESTVSLPRNLVDTSTFPRSMAPSKVLNNTGIVEDARNNPIMLHRTTIPSPPTFLPSQPPDSILPQTISTYVVRHLISQHPSLRSVKGCVVGVPAYFNDVQKEETEAAVKAAFAEEGAGEGVRVKVITEPEAASLAYSVASRRADPSLSSREENVLVFDLGGGTFDVTVVNVGYKSSGVVAGVEILATGGDRYLGGDDFDKLLVSYLKKKHGGDGWVAFAKGARVHLSNSKKFERIVDLPVSNRGIEDFDRPADGRDLHSGETLVTITRADLEKVLSPLLPRLVNPVREACVLGDICLLGDASPFTKEKLFGGKEGGRKGARIRENEIQSYKSQKQSVVDSTGIPLSSLKDAPGRRRLDRVILVGGATRTPLISSLLSTLTGLPPTSLPSVPPVYAVAMGCAVQGGILDGVYEDEEDQEGGFGVMTSMQAALLRALVEKERVLKKRREEGNDTEDA